MSHWHRPVFEAIKTKLVAETELRSSRDTHAWILAERTCVLNEVNRQRYLLGYNRVTIDEIERVERMAVGHVDYIDKFCRYAVDLVFQR